MPRNNNFTFANAINDALQVAMRKDSKMLCYGLGVTDPKGVFGTTLNLEKKLEEILSQIKKHIYLLKHMK